MKELFTIKGDYIELIKLLKAAGLVSTGGMAKIIIEDGLIKVDGKTEYRKKCKLKKGQTIEFDGNIIEIT